MAVAGHLTCVGATQQQVGKVIDDYIAAGARHIVALRGGRSRRLDRRISSGRLSRCSRPFAGIRRFSERCGTTIPHWIHELFAVLEDAPEVHQMIAATTAAEPCRQLAEHGVNQFHFSTMNKPEITAAICRLLGVHSCFGSLPTSASIMTRSTRLAALCAKSYVPRKVTSPEKLRPLGKVTFRGAAIRWSVASGAIAG